MLDTLPRVGYYRGKVDSLAEGRLVIDDGLHDDAMRRLKRIAGQVEGLSRMIDQRRYCVDVLHQIRAVEAALHKLGELVLRNHLRTCVADAFRSKRGAEMSAKIDELVRVYDGMRPK